MSRKSRFSILLICVMSLVTISLTLPDGLHSTPPMGWSSWNTFFGPGSEKDLMAQVNEFPIWKIKVSQFSKR